MLTFNQDVDYGNAARLTEGVRRFNEQFDPEKMLAVAAIFPTIQGEAPFAGRPAVFLRLAGCNRGAKINRGCAFCFPSHHAIKVSRQSPSTLASDADQEFTDFTIPLGEVQVGDYVDSYAEKPTSTSQKPARTQVTGVTKRMVAIDDLLEIEYESLVNSDTNILIVTKEHPLYVYADDGSMGDFIRADAISVGQVLHGAPLRPPFNTRINQLRVRRVSPVSKTTFGGLVQEQINTGVVDTQKASFSTDGLEVTSLTCSPYDTFVFKNVFVHNCDTFFAVNEQTQIFTITDLVAELSRVAQNMALPMLVITGGEPMLQGVALAEFLYHMSAEGSFNLIQFETNGDLFGTIPAMAVFDAALEINSEVPDDEEEEIAFVISPKRQIREPLTGAFMQYSTEPGFYLRLVVSGDETSPYYTVPQFLLDDDSGWPREEFYLSPLTEYKRQPNDTEIVDIAADIDLEATRRNVARAIHLATQLGLRVSLQAHSYIGIK